MAEKKKGSWGMAKISFFAICAAAVLYLVGVVLSALGLHLRVVSALQGIASALMICIVAVVAWSYVRHKTFVTKLLYIICLLLVIVGIIVPLVM